MNKKNHHVGQWILAVIAILFIALISMRPVKADQASLGDGSYSVPVTLLKSGSSATSMANVFFKNTANVKVTGSQYQIQLNTTGADYIKSMTMGGQAVNEEDRSGSNATLTVTLTSPSDLIPVTFDLQMIPILGAMKQSAQFQFDWSNATRTEGVSTNESSAGNSGAATPAATSSSTSSTPVVSSSSSSVVTREPNMVAPSTATKKTTKSKKVANKANAAAWKYVVLKADSNAKSMANKYYTHVAQVKKIKHHYQVLLKVSYKKSLKLGSKAVRPILINGRKPANIKYGSTTKTYTMTYSFNVSSTKTLKKVIAGKIHVKVPYLNISQTFGIRFKFSHAATTSKTTTKVTKSSSHQLKAKTATALPIARSQSKSKSEQLPQTGNDRNTSASVIGAVLGSGLLFSWGLSHEIK